MVTQEESWRLAAFAVPHRIYFMVKLPETLHDLRVEWASVVEDEPARRPARASGADEGRAWRCRLPHQAVERLRAFPRSVTRLAGPRLFAFKACIDPVALPLKRVCRERNPSTSLVDEQAVRRSFDAV